MPDSTAAATPFDASKHMSASDLASWNETRIQDTWRIFRIMSEFVEGFERLGRVGPSVSVFGSARTPPGTPYYDMAVAVGRTLVEHGYAVITGGGPGIMEAATKGAQEGGGASVGLGIVLPPSSPPTPTWTPTRT